MVMPKVSSSINLYVFDSRIEAYAGLGGFVLSVVVRHPGGTSFVVGRVAYTSGKIRVALSRPAAGRSRCDRALPFV
jgi:hypothetical protein